MATIDTSGVHESLRAALEDMNTDISLQAVADGTLTITLASGKNLIISGLPTSDPSVAGALWSNSGVVTVSAG